MEQIRLENVMKKYDGKLVLNGIDKVFYEGQSIAFMGHNGCGKSTLLKIIAGLTIPSSGKVIHYKPLLFHYVPERFLPVPLTARRFLIQMGAMDGLKTNEVRQKIETLANDFFLAELLDISMKSLSKGTLQKIGVIQALIRRPEVLLLDEPLSGQDIASQKVFIDKVNQLREQNVTILMSCHEQKLVDAVSEEVYTIENGNLLAYRPENEKIYTVIFENENHLEVTDQMTKYGRYYQIKADEAGCDRIVPELIQKGWKLRGMYDEENN